MQTGVRKHTVRARTDCISAFRPVVCIQPSIKEVGVGEGGGGKGIRGHTVRCARAVRKVGHSPPPGVR